MIKVYPVSAIDSGYIETSRSTHSHIPLMAADGVNEKMSQTT
jgi:hypothetical protein